MIDNLTIKEAREIAAMFGAAAQPAPQVSAYTIGQSYALRTVTHIITGRLLRICHDGLVVTDAAWIADTGRFAEFARTGSSASEVEPYPDGAEVIVNWQAMIDAFCIPHLPRVQK